MCDDDLPRFDASLADIQKQTIVAVVEFLDDQDIQADEPLSECSNSSKPMSVPASRINCKCNRICWIFSGTFYRLRT